MDTRPKYTTHLQSTGTAPQWKGAQHPTASLKQRCCSQLPLEINDLTALLLFLLPHLYPLLSALVSGVSSGTKVGQVISYEEEGDQMDSAHSCSLHFWNVISTPNNTPQLQHFMAIPMACSPGCWEKLSLEFRWVEGTAWRR